MATVGVKGLKKTLTKCKPCVGSWREGVSTSFHPLEPTSASVSDRSLSCWWATGVEQLSETLAEMCTKSRRWLIFWPKDSRDIIIWPPVAWWSLLSLKLLCLRMHMELICYIIITWLMNIISQSWLKFVYYKVKMAWMGPWSFSACLLLVCLPEHCIKVVVSCCSATVVIDVVSVTWQTSLVWHAVQVVLDSDRLALYDMRCRWCWPACQTCSVAIHASCSCSGAVILRTVLFLQTALSRARWVVFWLITLFYAPSHLTYVVTVHVCFTLCLLPEATVLKTLVIWLMVWYGRYVDCCFIEHDVAIGAIHLGLISCCIDHICWFHNLAAYYNMVWHGTENWTFLMCNVNSITPSHMDMSVRFLHNNVWQVSWRLTLVDLTFLGSVAENYTSWTSRKQCWCKYLRRIARTPVKSPLIWVPLNWVEIWAVDFATQHLSVLYPSWLERWFLCSCHNFPTDCN